MKYHEEYYIENAYFFKQASKYCCIYDIRELNHLERLFLEAIDYKLKVSEEEQETYFSLIQDKADELQCKKFKMYTKGLHVIEDYIPTPQKDSTEIDIEVPKKTPMVFLSGKLFKNSQEVFDFFHCEEICSTPGNNDVSTAYSVNSTLYTFSDESPRSRYFC